MSYRIAIHPDSVRHKNGKVQSFSERWTELAASRGIEIRTVNAFAPDFFDQLNGCDAFMWRFAPTPLPRLFAKRLLAAVEHQLRIPVFPSSKTAWHFEDKIAQHYLLKAGSIPSPDTWVFWKRDAALEFCRDASYPLVMKLSSGYQSKNVWLLRSRSEAEGWVRQMFGQGATSVDSRSPPLRIALRRGLRHLTGGSTRGEMDRCELQHGYFYVQEFLDGNAYDTRVTVIGDRAFAFRRFNRPADFRASGSGRINWDPGEIDLESVRLAFDAARRLETQTIAVDVLRRGDERVINDLTFAYASWAVRECPGHWILDGDADTGRLVWADGNMAPEDAIFDDFLESLQSRRTAAVI